MSWSSPRVQYRQIAIDKQDDKKQGAIEDLRRKKKNRTGEYHPACVYVYSTVNASSGLVGRRSVNGLSASCACRFTIYGTNDRKHQTPNLPASAVIIICHRSRTAPINPPKATTTIVQAIDCLCIVIPVLVLILVSGPGGHVGWEG